MSAKFDVIKAYRALSPDDQAIVRRVVMKVQMTKKEQKFFDAVAKQIQKIQNS